MINLLDLNQNQQTAITHNKGPMMVLSGPGSGKTTVISLRIKYLIENYNVNPFEILVVTFTKNSAQEMKERYLSLNNNNNNNYYNKVNFGTFHAHFYKIIRDHYNYELDSVINDLQKIEILKQALNNIYLNEQNIQDIEDIDIDEDFYKDLKEEISLVKNCLLNPQEFNSSITKNFFNIYSEYENLKSKLKKIDFDDMLIQCYNLLKNNTNIRERIQNKYKYILIDEFQDINTIQYECIKLLLTSKQNNIFVVGDDDQSIYSFRGSKPEILLNFPNDFPQAKRTILNINYRSTENIISLSNEIIIDNKKRFQKDLVSARTLGLEKISNTSCEPNSTLLTCRNTYVEAKEIAKQIKSIREKDQKNNTETSIAIIYRINMQVNLVIKELFKESIEYESNDQISSIYSDYASMNILAYLRLSQDGRNKKAFKNIINRPFRFLKADFIDSIVSDISKIKDKKIEIIEHMYIQGADKLNMSQLEKIQDLKFDLEIIKNKKPYDAIEYILETIGYKSYAEENNLEEQIKEIWESSKEYNTIREFLEYVDNISEDIKNKNKNNKNNKNKNIKDNKDNNNKDKSSNPVRLLTMHSSKGLEFDVVFIISCVENIIPHERSIKNKENKNLENALEEERRLLYVAITRAKFEIMICVVEELKNNPIKHSRFLNKFIKEE